ncbi:MAG: hypothetical protein M3R13_00670 [Armatimonadota bacterium]|nr:hypothetical protein [Armatimonadota bacterium]
MKLDSSEARVVRQVLERPGMTRNELADAIRTGTATTAAIARGLVERGALVESGATPSTGGRPAARLFVSSDFGHCFSHQVIEGRLHSCALDARGKILNRVDRPIDDVPSLIRGVDAAEMELSVKVPDGPPLASGIVVPGIVDRCTNTGEAHWLFGRDVINPAGTANNSLVISSAGCLTAMLEMGFNERFAGPWVSIDMAEGLSGLLLTRRCEAVPLHVTGLEPMPELVSKRSLFEAVDLAAVKKSSILGRKLATSKVPLSAVSAAVNEGDEVAATLVDELVIATVEFIGSVVRTLRPLRLILSSNLLDEALGCEESFRTALQRRGGLSGAAITLISPKAAIDQRFSGAALAAFDIRLSEIEGRLPKR